jgi:cholesterol transport system auxiliary component
MIQRPVALLACVGLSACSLPLSPRPAVARYDLGAEPSSPPAAQPLACVIVVHEPSAPAWLDGRSIHYRLGYQEPARIRQYAGSQWALSPVQLLGDRLRHCMAAITKGGGVIPDYGIEADYWLRMQIEDFSQLFDTPQASRGVVQVSVVLLKGRRRAFLAQTSFERAVAAPTADARGGVAALTVASDQLTEDIVAWVAAQTTAADKTTDAPRID